MHDRDPRWPSHEAGCAWVRDQVQMCDYGRFPVFEHACDCAYRAEWARGAGPPPAAPAREEAR